MMAGLGLAQGIRDYQKTYQNQVQFQQQQEQVQRQRKMQADIDAANKAAMDVIAQSQQEWQAQGAPGEYRPNAETFFRAAEARGNHLAKAGLFDAFMENEARVAPMKLRARTEALQRYQTDGDFDRLARSVYPTLFDGMTIKGSEVVGGNDDSAGPPEPAKYKFKLSNGSDVVLEPSKLVATLKASLVDPAESAKREALLNFERAKTEIHTAGRLKEIDAQGKSNMALEDKRAGNRLELQDAKDDEAFWREVQRGENMVSREAERNKRPAAAGANGRAPRGDDGMTPSERIRSDQQNRLGAERQVKLLLDQVKEKSKQMNEGPREDRAARRSELLALQAKLAAANDALEQLNQPQSLSDATPPKAGAGAAPVGGSAGLEMARSEAVSTGRPVQIDIGGRRGTFDAKGGLSDAAPSAKPSASDSKTPPVDKLKEGVHTKFKNGQVWMLRNGKPVKVAG